MVVALSKSGELSLVGAATSIIFVVAEVLSQQTRVCHDKTPVLSQQKYACWDKTSVATKIFCHTFVTTKDVFHHDKHAFVATYSVCSDQTFVVTKMILVGGPTNDSEVLQPCCHGHAASCL